MTRHIFPISDPDPGLDLQFRESLAPNPSLAQNHQKRNLDLARVQDRALARPFECAKSQDPGPGRVQALKLEDERTNLESSLVRARDQARVLRLVAKREKDPSRAQGLVRVLSTRGNLDRNRARDLDQDRVLL